MNKKSFAITIYLVMCLCLLVGCSYKPPYQRGYDEGYEAGVQAASGGAVSSNGGEAATVERSGLSTLKVSSVDESADEAEIADDVDDVEADEQGASDDGEASASSGEGTSSDVLGEESDPVTEMGDEPVTAPSLRVIRADAVNEALFSAPEVIEGLRTIYTDEAIFGEYVGDSETNLIHKVGGEHFSSLTYDTLVVYDESMSLQDILDEGFFTKCECVDE